jgi:hypothetical protein
MFLLRVDVPLGQCRTEGKYDTLADLPLSLRYSRHHSLAADFDYDTNTLGMKDSNSPDLDQHPILPKNPFIRVTASPLASISTSSASIDEESSSSKSDLRRRPRREHAGDATLVYRRTRTHVSRMRNGR